MTPVADGRRELIAAVGFASIGWEPRAADFAVVDMLTKGSTDEEDVIETVANYCWDHLLGEPDDLSEVAIAAAIRVNLEAPCGGEAGQQ